jgi:hypothetical protein
MGFLPPQCAPPFPPFLFNGSTRFLDSAEAQNGGGSGVFHSVFVVEHVQLHRVGNPVEGERDSGGKANSFCRLAEWRSAWSGMFSTGKEQ